MSAAEIVVEEINKEQKELPKTMSLDEYIGSRGDQLQYGTISAYIHRHDICNSSIN